MNRAKINFILNSIVSKGELHVTIKNFYDHMNKVFFYSILFLFVTVTSCKEDDEDQCCDPTNPECANYDPCFGNEPTAEFKMRGTSVGFPVSENLVAEWCDTIFNSGVEFMADMEDADVYEWYIGTETEPRFGRSFKLGFGDYYDDTFQNLNPNNPDYYLPIDISLIVRNDEGICVNESDTTITFSRQLILTRKTLTSGTFIGRIEGEDSDREIQLWKDLGDLSNPDFQFWYVSGLIGFPPKDTLRIYHAMSPLVNDQLISFKRYRWKEDWQNHTLSRDGIYLWEQEITTIDSGSDLISLHFERISESNGEIQEISFSGERSE